jgi:hypothetical protein
LPQNILNARLIKLDLDEAATTDLKREISNTTKILEMIRYPTHSHIIHPTNIYFLFFLAAGFPAAAALVAAAAGAACLGAAAAAAAAALAAALAARSSSSAIFFWICKASSLVRAI